MQAHICQVTVNAELIAIVENMSTLCEEGLFYLTYLDESGKVFHEGTYMVEFAE